MIECNLCECIGPEDAELKTLSFTAGTELIPVDVMTGTWNYIRLHTSEHDRTVCRACFKMFDDGLSPEEAAFQNVMKKGIN
jgi:hypothetical protein